MPEAKTYRQYAADCRRLAKTMNQKDGAILLKMAEAWRCELTTSRRLK